MNSFNHICIGKILYSYLTENGIILNKKYFIYGNVLPDIHYNVVLKPHYIENYKQFLEKEVFYLKHLYKSQNDSDKKEYSKRLGVLCHYLSDFFCFAHNRDFKGSSVEHMKYELKLNKYSKSILELLQNSDEIKKNDTPKTFKEFYEKITTLHNVYMADQKSYKLDLFSSLGACVMTLFYISV